MARTADASATATLAGFGHQLGFRNCVEIGLVRFDGFISAADRRQ
jgi:hypothetical protein